MSRFLLAQVAPIYNPAINRRIGNTFMSASPAEMLNLILNNLLVIALSIAGLYFFLNLIRGGYEWITAGGDKESVQKARGRLQNAILGVVIIFSIYTITFVVEYFFGTNLISFDIPRP